MVLISFMPNCGAALFLLAFQHKSLSGVWGFPIVPNVLFSLVALNLNSL